MAQAASAPLVDESKLPEWVKRQARSPYKVIIESQAVKPKASPPPTQTTQTTQATQAAKDDEAARRVAKKAALAAATTEVVTSEKARPVVGAEAAPDLAAAMPDSGSSVAATALPGPAPVIEQAVAVARPLSPEPVSSPVLAAPPEPPPLQLLDGGDPVIPADAFDNQRSRAEVVVRFTVTPTGEVSKLTLVASNNSRLNRSVLRAVQGWRYAPIATAREHNVSFAFTPQ